MGTRRGTGGTRGRSGQTTARPPMPMEQTASTASPPQSDCRFAATWTNSSFTPIGSMEGISKLRRGRLLTGGIPPTKRESLVGSGRKMVGVIVSTPAVCAKRSAPPFVLIKPLASIIWGGRTTRAMGFTERLFCSGLLYAAQWSCDFRPQFPLGRYADPD